MICPWQVPVVPHQRIRSIGNMVLVVKIGEEKQAFSMVEEMVEVMEISNVEIVVILLMVLHSGFVGRNR